MIAVSRSAKQDAIASGVNPEKILLATNGVNIEAIRMFRNASVQVITENIQNIVRLGFPLGAGPIILSVSRIVEHKGVDRVIEVMPYIRQVHPDARFVIVGDGPDTARIKELASRSPAREGIHVMGRLTEHEKFACYELCDAYVMPSLIEGFGLVFLEANAFGKPVVGANTMGTPEAILHDKTGVLVEPHNQRDLLNAVLSLLDNRDYAKRLGENGRRRAERDFSWDRTAGIYRSLIYDVAGV